MKTNILFVINWMGGGERRLEEHAMFFIVLAKLVQIYIVDIFMKFNRCS